MTVAVTQVSIANDALQALGEPGILSFDQDSPAARAVLQSYEGCRDDLMRRYDWGFCIKRASIAALSTLTITDDLNQYPLPADYARLLRPEDFRADWKIEGRNIVTADGAPLEFRYVARIEDPAQFDALFVTALGISLAITICKKVTGSNAGKDDLRKDFKEAISEAKKANAFERDAQVPLEDDYITAML